jgi:hypothetical protein
METFMQSFNFVQLIGQLGLAGLVLVLWVFSDRGRARDIAVSRKDAADLLEKYRDDTQRILTAYREDASEARRYYQTNVTLVESYLALAKDLKDIVVLNTQVWTRTFDAVASNQYCPLNRVDKDAKGPQG